MPKPTIQITNSARSMKGEPPFFVTDERRDYALLTDSKGRRVEVRFDDHGRIRVRALDSMLQIAPEASNTVIVELGEPT